MIVGPVVYSTKTEERVVIGVLRIRTMDLVNEADIALFDDALTLNVREFGVETVEYRAGHCKDTIEL